MELYGCHYVSVPATTSEPMYNMNDDSNHEAMSKYFV